MRSQIRTASVVLVAVLTVGMSLSAPKASAGSYIVAQCSPGLFQDAPEAGYTTTSDHFTAVKDCGPEQPGVQIGHVLVGGATGTEQGRYGAWVWQAPPGTFITGGSVYSRLATENGIHGYLAVSPDNGAGEATENQNDDQLHLSAIPSGQWRYFVERLECTTPNEGNRCVGSTPNAHAYVKQLRLQLTDVAQPTLSVGGSMFSGQTLRGEQTIAVSAADQGSGVSAVGVSVNGIAAAGDNLSAACHLLPGNLTSSMAPCPASFGNTYSLNTEDAPFHNGQNSVSVCVSDYAQDGHPNVACTTQEVTVDALCPASPRAGGSRVTAGFGNGKTNRVLPYGRRALLRGRVLDGAGNGVEGAQVCIEGHMMLTGRSYRLLGTATTNQNGGWSFKLHKGASREFLVAYRAGGQQVETTLSLHVRAHATLHVSKLFTAAHRPIVFSGTIPGPAASERVVILRGSVPGARRHFLVRRARTDALGHYRMRYRFSRPPAPTRFVFSVIVPQQAGYPYLRGRSPHRFIRVLPGARKHHHHHRHHKHHHRHHKHHHRHHKHHHRHHKHHHRHHA